jgi:hypothetical protein
MSRQDRILQQMLGLDQSAQNDMQLAMMAEEMAGKRAMQPFQEEGADLANQLMRQQVTDGPNLAASKAKNFELQSIGDLAQGMYGQGDSSDIIAQLLESGGHYRPDPEAALKKKAAQYGMTVEQLKAQIQQLTPPSK